MPDWNRHPTAISIVCRGLGAKCVGRPVHPDTYSSGHYRRRSTCVVAIADGNRAHQSQTALVSTQHTFHLVSVVRTYYDSITADGGSSSQSPDNEANPTESPEWS